MGWAADPVAAFWQKMASFAKAALLGALTRTCPFIALPAIKIFVRQNLSLATQSFRGIASRQTLQTAPLPSEQRKGTLSPCINCNSSYTAVQHTSCPYRVHSMYHLLQNQSDRCGQQQWNTSTVQRKTVNSRHTYSFVNVAALVVRNVKPCGT